MPLGPRRRFLVRGVVRSLRRIDGLGRSFRIVVNDDGPDKRVTVEAETREPASDAQIASLGAKLLDALAGEMSEVVREAMAEARASLTLRLLQPGSLPRRVGGRRRPAPPADRNRVH
jgi:phenylacetate-coenzyme A ligase PaaK-like adenylate-forming protein